ncbi:hypothetical protein [Desulfovibrio sp. JC022]|uniref:hypothetical protein n=1 Tax=Desulfovibrio sp. JC022 TaxID=2593642 RepID=UPI0013D70C07|nr:hypothetical protein [Desulfovibrio sp. JC022]NDV24729.1 hypothetical protein [Desulfovibrio sp. JC022]
MRHLLLPMLAVLTLFFAGCTNDIDKVKGGTFNNRPALTIGQAFDSAFDMPLWSESKGERGEKLVNFSGIISPKLHDRAVDRSFIDFIVVTVESYQSGQIFKALELGEKVEKIFGGEKEYEQIVRQFQKQNLSKDDASRAAIYLALSMTEWPQGTPVSITWIIHPDGKRFDLQEIQSDALAGKTVSIILDSIYGSAFTPNTVIQQKAGTSAEQIITKVKPIVQNFIAAQAEQKMKNRAQAKLLSIPTEKVDELAVAYLSPPKKENVIGNWVHIGKLPDQYGGSVTRLVTDDAHETGSRVSRDFLCIDFDDRDKTVPAINIAVGIVTSLDEAIQAYAGVKMFDVLVDGQKQGRIKMIGRPTPSKGYMYLEYSECPAISLIYKAMVSGQRVEFVNSQDKFSFDLRGLSSAAEIVLKS